MHFPWPLVLLTWAGMAVAEPVGDCRPDAEAAARLLNATRSHAQVCGGRRWPAAQALRWQGLLEQSSRRYALELAARDRLDHIGASGATLRTRLHETGYVMRVAGENLAGGPESFEEALAQWLASPAHCENLMAADFEDFGLACVTGPGRLQRYWVLQMGAPVEGARQVDAPR